MEVCSGSLKTTSSGLLMLSCSAMRYFNGAAKHAQRLHSSALHSSQAPQNWRHDARQTAYSATENAAVSVELRMAG